MEHDELRTPDILTFDAKLFTDDKDEEGTFRAIVMTETRIPNHFQMPDGTYVDELLLTSGLQMPEGNVVPLIDNHDYSSVRSVLGDVKLSLGSDDDCDCNADDDDDDCACDWTLFGKLNVDPSESVLLSKIKRGKVKSVSVGITKPQSKEARFIPEGKSRTYNGKQYDGPLVVYEKPRPFEVSLTAFPANTKAKIQLSILNTFQQEEDTESIPAGDIMVEQDKVEIKEGVQLTELKPTEAVVKASAVDVDKEIKAALTGYKQFTSQVRQKCARFDLADKADSLSEKYSTIEEVRGAVLDLIHERQKENRPLISVTGDGNTRRMSAQRDALFYTMLQNVALEGDGRNGRPNTFEKNAPKNVDENFIGMSLAGHSRLILEAQGKNCRFWNDSKVLTEALRFSEQSYMTSGSLANILSDNLNKTLIVGYQDAIVTYDQVFTQLSSQSNLKNAYAIRLSGVGYLDVWVENTVPLQKTAFDSKQAIKMIPWADHVPVPWHILRNDDLGALSSLPLELGRAARRTLNRECWMPIFANQIMDEDSVALFDHTTRTNANDYTTSNPPSSVEVQNLQQLMSAQTDKDGSLISNLGKYLIVPPASDRLGRIACGSEYDVPTGSGVAYLPNVYKGQIECVTEPLLGQNSNTIWYLSCAKSTSPVAYVFLAGEETPYTDSFIDPHTDGLVIKARQTFGVAAYDYRRITRHA